MRFFLAFSMSLIVLAPIGAVAEGRPNAQLVTSVQHRLDLLGFREVNARTLTTRQIAALHLQLDGRPLGPAGLFGSEARQRVRIILGWD